MVFKHSVGTGCPHRLIMMTKCLATVVLLISLTEASRLGRQYSLQATDSLLSPQSTEESQPTCRDLWFTPSNGTCRCGSSLNDVVSCNEQTKVVMIADCYCMTHESVTKQMVVGDCFYNCLNLTSNEQYDDYIYHKVPSQCGYLPLNRHTVWKL